MPSKFVVVCVASLLLSSCLSKGRGIDPSSSVQEFEKAKFGEATPVQMQLANLDALGVKYQVSKRSTDVFSYDGLRKLPPSAADIVEVALSINSAQQVHELNRVFGGQTVKEFTAGQTYSLVDFLPPLVQALNGHRFLVHDEYTKVRKSSGELTEREIQTMTNCWTTAYEIARLNSPVNAARSEKSMSVFFISGPQIERVLKDPKFGKRLNSSAELRPGDMILISKRAGEIYGPNAPRPTEPILLHAAIFVDTGLFFEKTGVDSQNLYRLVQEQDMMAPYVISQNGARAEVIIDYLRHDGSEPLPDPAEIGEWLAEKFNGIDAAGNSREIRSTTFFDSDPENGYTERQDLVQFREIALERKKDATGDSDQFSLGLNSYIPETFKFDPKAPRHKWVSDSLTVPLAVVSCPQDFSKVQIGREGGFACIKGDRYIGPFTTRMREDCSKNTGNQGFCKERDWPRDVALKSRGVFRCPAGSDFVADIGYCIEFLGRNQGVVLGPHTLSHAAKCPSPDSSREICNIFEMELFIFRNIAGR